MPLTKETMGNHNLSAVVSSTLSKRGSLKDVVYTTKTLPANLDPEVEEFRCVNCNRFLGLIAIMEGTVCLKCKRCKIWSVIDVHQVVDNEVELE